MPGRSKESDQRPGIGVDAQGGGVIDPTQNVRELVLAESKYQDSARVALKELMVQSATGIKDSIKMLSEGIVSYQNSQRDSETRRIDQLAQTRQEFQNTIRDMLAESVRTTSTLVSTQLVQIQATFDTRVSKLEAGAFTQAGKQSVQDPQITDAMSRMSSAIAALAASTTESMAKINATNTEAMAKTEVRNTEAMAKLVTGIAALREEESGVRGGRKGMQDTNARLLSVVMAVAAVASPVISILVTIMVMRGH